MFQNLIYLDFTSSELTCASGLKSTFEIEDDLTRCNTRDSHLRVSKETRSRFIREV